MNISQKYAKYKLPLIHVMVWAAIFLIPYIFNSENMDERGHRRSDFLYIGIANKVFWVLVFYWNTQYLIPHLLYRKRYFYFFILQLIVFLSIVYFDKVLFVVFEIQHPYRFYRVLVHNFSPFVFTSLASVALKSVWDKFQNELASQAKAQENLKTELSFLRSQISPHFLFNILNNIVAMIRLKSENLEETVLNFSNLLQYMLYETDEEKVFVETEVQYLNSYIELQKQRFGAKIRVQTDIHTINCSYMIEPMLLIPFVENAFKHGYISQQSHIDIKLKLTDNVLTFMVTNTFDSQNNQKDKVSGIGLNNVRRRLELLYKNNHKLIINSDSTHFYVKLIIKLSE